MISILYSTNSDWTPAALAAATQFGSFAKLSVLTKLDGLAGIMRLGRRYDTQRLNRYSENHPIEGALPVLKEAANGERIHLPFVRAKGAVAPSLLLLQGTLRRIPHRQDAPKVG